MTMFWIGVAALVAMAWLMVWPAWRQRPAPAEQGAAYLSVLKEQLASLDRDLAAGTLDAQQHALARQEVQRRVLDESPVEPGSSAAPVSAGLRRTALIVGLAIPLFGLAVYAAIGNLAGLAPPPAAEARGTPDISPEAIEAMLTKLAQRLEKPSGDAASDLKGWTMLARSYAALQRFPEADRAYARAIVLAPNDASLLADRADVLAMMQDQSLKGEPDRLLAQALQLDPNNLKALALAGASAVERKDLAAARSFWQRARALAAPGSEFAAGLDRSLSEVGVAALPANAGPGVVANAGPGVVANAGPASVANAGPSPAASAPAAPTQAAAEPARISGRVSLAPALAARAAPTDTVFIFARAAEGPRMPLAILRRTVAELPIAFTLDDSMAMSPEMKLSRFPRVVVGARISRSGNAMPQPGDLRGESAPTGTQASGLQLVIDGVQP